MPERPRRSRTLGEVTDMRLAWLTAFAALLLCLAAGRGNSQDFEVVAHPIANEGAAYLLVGQVNQLSLFHRAKAEQAPSARVTWEILVPPSVEILPGIGGEPNLHTTAEGDRLATIEQSAAGADWAQVMLLLLPTEYLEPEAKLQWRLTWEGGQFDWASVPIICLPAVAASRPQRLICGAWPHNLVKAEGQSAVAVADLLASTGLNYIYTYSPQSVRLLEQRGLHPVLEQVALQGTTPFTERGRDHPEVTAQGERRGMCPQYILDTAGEAIAPIRDWVAAAAKEAGTVSLDWEWGKWGEPGVDTCFDPLCLTRFAQQEKIREPLLTPQLILDNYAKQWVAFRNEQYVGMLRLLYRAAKAANPASKLLYLPYTAETTSPEGGGWKLVPLLEQPGQRANRYLAYADVPKSGDYLDIFAPMYYAHGGGAIRELFLRTEALRKATDVEVVHFIVGQADVYEAALGTNAPRALKAMMLAAAAAGGGTILYPATMGGLAWHNAAQAANAIATLEPFFLEGERGEGFYRIKGLPLTLTEITTDERKVYLSDPDFQRESMVRGYRLWRSPQQGQLLVLVFNLSEANDLFYKLALPGLTRGRYQLLDVANDLAVGRNEQAPYFSETELAEGVTLRTPKEFGVSAYLIFPYSPARIAKAQYEERTRQEYHQRGSYTKLDARRQTAGEMRGGAGTDAEGRFLLFVENREQAVFVAPGWGGRIVSWGVKGAHPVRVVGAEDRYAGAALDLFWVPPQAHWGGDEISPYRIDSWGVTEERAWLRLTRLLSHPALRGLRLQKEISIAPGQTQVEVTVKVENTSKQALTLSYWAHSVPLLQPEVLPAGEPLRASRGLQLELPQPGGILRVRTDLADALFAAPGAPYSAPENEPFEKQARVGEFQSEWAALVRSDKNLTLKAYFDPKEVLQVYSWRNGTVTLEWMYRPVILAPDGAWQTRYRLVYGLP